MPVNFNHLSEVFQGLSFAILLLQKDALWTKLWDSLQKPWEKSTKIFEVRERTYIKVSAISIANNKRWMLKALKSMKMRWCEEEEQGNNNKIAFVNRIFVLT